MQKIQTYFELLRAPRAIVGTLIVIKMGLFNFLNADMHMGIGSYLLLILALFLIGISGFLIHDIYNVGPDKINYPNKVLVQEKISLRTAKNIYWALSISGVVLGMLISLFNGYPSYGVIFIAIASIPYFYSTTLKNSGIVGNLIIASLGFVIFVIPAIFDLMPAITTRNQYHQAQVFKILLLYGGFAFALIYIEMLIANIRSLPGDRKWGVKTIAYHLGFDKTKLIALISSIIVLALLIFSIVKYVYTREVLLYFIFAVIAPFLYFIIQLYYLKLEKMVNQINILQHILRIVYTTGFVSIILLNYFN